MKERNYFKTMNFAQKEASYYKERKSSRLLARGTVRVTCF